MEAKTKAKSSVKKEKVKDSANKDDNAVNIDKSEKASDIAEEKKPEATGDISSELADMTVEGSASDSSEADAEHPSDGSDGTEEVA